jgi:RimJ/RimL family protein N-acetyltransferase
VSTEVPDVRVAAPLVPPLPGEVDRHGVVLRRLGREDAEAFHGVVHASAAHLVEFMPWAADEPASLEDRLALLERWDREWRAGGSAVYAIPDDAGAPCGAVGLHRRGGPQTLEIGYWIAPWEQGKGRVTTAARVLTIVAFSYKPVDTVVIRHDAANVRSGAVPARLGFQRVGAETRDAEAGGESGITVHWEARRGTWDPGRA